MYSILRHDCELNYCNSNFILFTQLPWGQAATLPPIHHTRFYFYASLQVYSVLQSFDRITTTD